MSSTSAGYILIFIVAELIFLVGAVYTYRARGWTWTSAGLIAMSVLGLGGVLEGVVRTMVVRSRSPMWARAPATRSALGSSRPHSY